MAIAATYLSDASFTAAGDLTAELAPTVRIKADCGPDGQRYGTVASVSAQDGVTTVVLTMDAAPLTANLSAVQHGNDVPASLCNHAAQHAAGGRDPLAAATTDAPGVAELATNAEALAGTDTARVPPLSALRQAYRSWQRDDAGRFPGLLPPAFNLFAPGLALPGATTFSRASSGWVVGAAGIVKSYAANLPRFDYDANGALLGLRIEGAATRLNTIAAAPTAPENITVTAQVYTISFSGTGSVVLSGAHAATVGGAGALPARAAYTFTPTAGTLTVTPSGTVQNLQLETGPLATSPILGEGGAVTRAADMVTVNLSGIDFNPSEGALFLDAYTAPGIGTGIYQSPAALDNGGSSSIQIIRGPSRYVSASVAVGGATQAALASSAAILDNTRFRLAFSWAANAFRLSFNGGAVTEDTTGTVPTGLSTLRIGMSTGVYPWNGHIRHLAYFPRALTASQLQAMSL
jgi:hypothetical protein